MQNDRAENTGGPKRAMKYVLMAFVAVSIAAAAYKITAVPRDPGASGPVAVARAGAASPEPGNQAAAPAVKSEAASSKRGASERTAVVYYFYTNARCSSCKTIETYTREAVEKNFTADYRGWRVMFKGVNVEEEPDTHFVQDYWLNSKSVVLQTFSGGKALKYIKLEKVWQLLGDKEAFMSYVVGETHRLLDEQ